NDITNDLLNSQNRIAARSHCRGLRIHQTKRSSAANQNCCPNVHKHRIIGKTSPEKAHIFPMWAHYERGKGKMRFETSSYDGNWEPLSLRRAIRKECVGRLAKLR